MARHNLKKILMRDYNIEASVSTSFTNFIGRTLGLTAVMDHDYNNILLVDNASTKDEFLKSMCERMLNYSEVTSSKYKEILSQIEERYTKPHPAIEELKNLKEKIALKENELEASLFKLSIVEKLLEEAKEINKDFVEYLDKDGPLGDLVKFVKDNKDFVVSCKDMRNSFFKIPMECVEKQEVEKQISETTEDKLFKLSDKSLTDLGNVFISYKTEKLICFPRACKFVFVSKDKEEMCKTIGIDYIVGRNESVWIKESKINEFVEKFNICSNKVKERRKGK